MKKSINKSHKSKFNKWIKIDYGKELDKVKNNAIIAFLYEKYFIENLSLTIKQKQNLLLDYFIKNILKTDFFEVASIEAKRNKIIKKVKNKTGKTINENNFYLSTKWLILKRKVLNLYKCGCMKCGALGVEKHVDHIFPRSKYPKFQYDIHNLQILCKKCNIEKSNLNTFDYRTINQKKLCSSKYI